MIEHAYFIAINFVVLALLLFYDRKRIKEYLLLFAVVMPAALIFENLTTYLGFWFYHSEPKIFLLSFYTWLLYIPFIGFCYFLGKRFGGRNG